MKLSLSPPKGWCEHGPPRSSAGLGYPSYQHLSLPRHPQGCPKGLRSLAVGPLASTVHQSPRMLMVGGPGYWGRLAP